jgi:hypothetical protein
MPANDNRSRILPESEDEMVAAIVDQARRLRDLLDVATEAARRLDALRQAARR